MAPLPGARRKAAHAEHWFNFITTLTLTLTRRASQHGHLCARRGVRGGVLGLWQGLRYPRITQRVRVGELDPKLYSLGVGG